MDCPTLALAVLRELVSPIIVGGAVVWLGKEFVKNGLKALGDGHIKRIEHDNEVARDALRRDGDAALERIRLDGSSAIEKLRADLQVAIDLAQLRHSSLVQLRAAAIAELYGLVVEAETACQKIVSLERLTGKQSGVELLNDAGEKLKLLLSHFRRNRILLAPETCKLIENLFQEVAQVFVGSGVLEVLVQVGGKQMDPTTVFGIVQALWERQSQIDAARTKLESDFRKLLGAE